MILCIFLICYLITNQSFKCLFENFSIIFGLQKLIILLNDNESLAERGFPFLRLVYSQPDCVDRQSLHKLPKAFLKALWTLCFASYSKDLDCVV
jgi:hypothetical protein